MDGAELSGPDDVRALFVQLRGRAPFMFELVGENGHNLLVGRGDDCGCVQFSRADGTPPYLMAVSEEPSGADELVEFLAGGTPTPIPQRFCLPLFFLPGYSPHLNPDEFLNQDVKSNALGRQRPATRAEMIEGVRSYLRSTQRQPAIVQSYFQAESVRYAAG